MLWSRRVLPVAPDNSGSLEVPQGTRWICCGKSRIGRFRLISLILRVLSVALLVYIAYRVS
jgi:hypothetical protein